MACDRLNGWVATVAVLVLAALVPAHGALAREDRLRLGGLEARVWRSPALSGTPRLVIVVHGDSARPPPEDHYHFASEAAKRSQDTIVVAVLRPGYVDRDGAVSEGRRGWTTGDNYTPEVTAAVLEAVVQAKAKYHARDVTLIGHSGGAAIAANVAEAAPEVVDRLLLVSCVCDLAGWRAYIARTQFNPFYLLPVRSQSPQDGVDKLSPALKLALVVGDRDRVTPPVLSEAFAQAARARGVSARVDLLEGKGHDILRDERVVKLLMALQAE